MKLKDGDEIKIHIKRKDIREGIRANCYRCPGALAIARKLRKLGIDYYPTTTGMTQSFTGNGYSMMLRHPMSMVTWIGDFDDRGPGAVSPARFTLTVVLGPAQPMRPVDG